MEYLINNNLKYNSLDGTLFNPDFNVDMITLARISNELLLLFILNAKSLLSRDEILNELWEKRGLSASSNNLNNHVSILRKALAECGCTGIITTVPKHGFLFDAEISLIEAVNTPLLVIPAHIDDTQPTTQTEVSVINAHKGKLLTPFVVKLLMFVSLVLITTMAYNLYDYLRINSVRNEVFRIKQCRFYLFDDLTRRLPHKRIIERLQAIVTTESIECDLQANVYYSADKKLDSTGKSTLHDFFSYCPFNSKAPCENYVFNATEGQHEKN